MTHAERRRRTHTVIYRQLQRLRDTWTDPVLGADMGNDDIDAVLLLLERWTQQHYTWSDIDREPGTPKQPRKPRGRMKP